ncbi:MAG: hypothetical protein BM557_01985 [Flavobacterium sp. MedPE-SWcel]|uniref:hypothetical protein n=1 Tax=uncultured Flavobacterium sp. TaxID=165435 RepID=UPI000914199F|nr:hypothetical protein [uncultured Flavobacterium sp.]OIQ22167.1 MAG: hypothetical protein BM557_01985 [Flavobacterium sp. MedPE-SWcel]
MTDTEIEEALHELEIEEQLDKRKDSISKVINTVIITDEHKVISDINFGDDKNIVTQKLKQFVKKSERTKFKNYDGKYPFIGDYEFSDYYFDDRYYNNKLYYLIIKGRNIDYDKYKTELRSQLESIKSVIELKYGKPSLNKGLPKMYDIDEEYYYTAYSWRLGAKKIDILIDEEGVDYRVDLRIYQPEILNKVSEERKAKEKETVESAKEVF